MAVGGGGRGGRGREEGEKGRRGGGKEGRWEGGRGFGRGFVLLVGWEVKGWRCGGFTLRCIGWGWRLDDALGTCTLRYVGDK